MKKGTLIAAGVFAVLLVAVLATREDKVNQGVPKLSLPALSGEVTGLELKDAKLTYEGGSWKVNGNAAEESQVKGLVDALKDFRATDFVTDKAEKHAELEVDDAKGQKLVVSTAAGPQWSLVFGKMAKAGGMYVREAKSNAVFTTTSPVGWQAKKKASDWRKKAISTAQYGDVKKVTLTRPASAFTLELGEGDTWTMQPPPPAGFRYDPEAAKRLVQSATSLQAQDFGDSLGEQQASLELELKDGKKVALKLGAKRPEGTVPLSVDGDPQVYLLAEWTAQNLLKAPEDFRDTTLLAAFEPEKVSKVSITAGGKTTTLAKSGAEWKVLEPKKLPDGFELDPMMVMSTLQRFKSMRATKAETGVAEKAAGLAKPTAQVELQVDGGGKQVVKFGAETAAKDAVYVKGTADALTYSIPVGQKTSLEQGLEMFKKRPPPDMNQIRGLDQLPPEVRRQLEMQLKQQRM